MESQRGFGRVSRAWWAVTALAALGASPQEPWETARNSLPPVTVAPNVPLPPVQGQPIAPVPLPMPMPPRIDRAVVPASNPVPALQTTIPTRPVAPAPSLAPRPAPSLSPNVAPSPAPPASLVAPSLGAPPLVANAPELVAAPNTRVYVINGLDPFGWGGLSQMADRIRDSGYPDTRFGAWYQVLKFDREIRAMHRQDPGAQVVLIGYSLGVYRAKALAGRLTRDGIPVAMVGYIGGDYLRNTPSSLAGGTRVVNVTGDGYLLTGKNLLFNGTELTGADNVRMPGVRHFGLPKQEQTLNALVNGINSATGSGWSSPAVVAGSSGVPGRIAVGTEVIPPVASTPNPYTSASPYAAGRR